MKEKTEKLRTPLFTISKRTDFSFKRGLLIRAIMISASLLVALISRPLLKLKSVLLEIVNNGVRSFSVFSFITSSS